MRRQHARHRLGNQYGHKLHIWDLEKRKHVARTAGKVEDAVTNRDILQLESWPSLAVRSRPATEAGNVWAARQLPARFLPIPRRRRSVARPHALPYARKAIATLRPRRADFVDVRMRPLFVSPSPLKQRGRAKEQRNIIRVCTLGDR